MMRAFGIALSLIFGGLTAITLFFATMIGIAYLFGAKL
jgi:hypothetical protein